MKVSLAAGTGWSIATMLERLSELPSTPEVVLSDARRHVGHITARLPEEGHHWEPGERTPVSAIDLDAETVNAVAELLETFAEMPSTPPLLADEAREHAEALWQELG